MTIDEATKQLAENIGKAIAELHIDNLIAVIKNENCDPYVNLSITGISSEYYETIFCITPMLEEIPTIGGTSKQEICFYYVQKVEYDPGVYRYKDGSGEPPSSELIDVHKTRCQYDAIAKLLGLYAESTVRQMFDSIVDNLMVTDEEY